MTPLCAVVRYRDELKSCLRNDHGLSYLLFRHAKQKLISSYTFEASPTPEMLTPRYTVK